MRWPWKHEAPDPSNTDDAYRALERAMNQWPVVHETTDHIRRLRAENHFAEKIRTALEGR